jgi:cobaltochelatase CobS
MTTLIQKDYSITETFGIAAGSVKIAGYEFTDHPAVPAIDPHYEFDLPFIRLMTAFIRKSDGDGLMLIGPTGAGKTSGVVQFAARIGYPVTVPTISPRTEITDLMGGLFPQPNGSFVWRDGPLTRAVREGHIFVIDEFNILDPGELMGLVTLLDHRKLHIPTTDEVIPVHAGFRLVVTGNAGTSGDQTGLYAGVRQGNLAFGDRFISMKIGYLPPEKELAILAKTNPGLSEEMRGNMVQVAKDVRKLFTGEDGMGGGAIGTTISTRTLRRWGSKIAAFAQVNKEGTRQFHPKVALEVALTSRISADEATAIENICQAVFGPAWR